MTNITINAKNNTIVITKAVAKDAQKFGSKAYKDLLQAQRDFPNFRVVIKKTTTKKDAFAGLSYGCMEKYIEKHDDENKSIMKTFNDLRATSDEAKDLNMESSSYNKIKEWFFKTYPEVEAFQKRREAALAA